MTGQWALGIDVGTSGVRAALLDDTGDVVAEAAARMDDHGTNLRSPEVWRQTLAAALHTLSDMADLKQVGAVSVDGTSGTVLALAADGTPIGDALMYNDAVEDPAIVTRLTQASPENSAARGAASGLARAIALQDRSAAKILHQADWIAGLLAQDPVSSDESNALKSGYDPVARCWPDWMADTGMEVSLLPDVVAAGQETGKTSGAFGLPIGAKVVAGVSDGCAAFLATGADRPGDGVTSLGTTLTIKLLSDKPVFAPEYGIYSHRIGDRWLAGGASNTGGGVLQQFFDTATLAALSNRIDPRTSSGLDYYPLSRPGERFPVSDPNLPPRLEPRPKEDSLFLHGLLEAMARIEAEGYSKLAELGAPQLATIRTVGGGASNPVWTGLRLNTLNVPEAPARSTSAAAGVARLALAALAD